jgi:osmotically-inducible protein OsmY
MSDEKIKKDVVNQLYWDSRLETSDVCVAVSKGKVILTGTVPSHHLLKVAETDCLAVAGVAAVQNDLEVEWRSPANTPIDEEIRKNIETLLSWNRDVDINDIDISVDGGFVKLNGSVDSLWKKEKVEKLVSTVSGALYITNNLSVVPSQSILDRFIADDITAALERDIRVNAADIDVKVEDGVVTLTGTLLDWGAYHAAAEIAKHTRGVVGIHDKLSLAGSL